MSLSLTVHRGTTQIGGSCIELEHPSGERLILDAGRPLDAPEGITGLLPQTLDKRRPANVLFSHPHQDHWGLIEELPQDWPVWAGAAAAKLITITSDVTRRPLTRTFLTWDSNSALLRIGPFSIQPILIDHSAFDAYMLLIEACDRRVLYTGDFRRHGRKSALVNRLISHPPKNINVLLTEGTNLGSDKPVKTEAELEEDFLDLFKRTRGRIFVMWSAQNIDRTVTLYRAAKKAGRCLMIDLYTADVLDQISDGTALPRPGFPNLKVIITRGLSRYYRRRGRTAFVDRMVPYGISARRLQGVRDVIMLRGSLLRDYQQAGVQPSATDAVNFSMWRGYMSDPSYSEPIEWCRSAGGEVAFIHTSGHASASDLRAFATAVSPQFVVPVHGVKWDDEDEGFGVIRRLKDGESWRIP